MVRFRFFECFENLVHIGTHAYIRDINIAVAHHHSADVFLAYRLTACGKLRDRAERGRFGSLTAGIGVNFRIHDKDIDVSA